METSLLSVDQVFELFLDTICSIANCMMRMHYWERPNAASNLRCLKSEMQGWGQPHTDLRYIPLFPIQYSTPTPYNEERILFNHHEDGNMQISFSTYDIAPEEGNIGNGICIQSSVFYPTQKKKTFYFLISSLLGFRNRMQSIGSGRAKSLQPLNLLLMAIWLN